MFSFGFNIDEDGENTEVQEILPNNKVNEFMKNSLDLKDEFVPTKMSFSELLGPDQSFRISYEKLNIAQDITIAKRDIYDVKYALMRKDNLTETEHILLNENEDIRKSTYEGGIKVWECTLDLIEYLSQHQHLIKSSILEMGCGAGLPSVYILQILLQRDHSDPVRLTVGDYNRSVLELTTAPNMLLAWLIVNNPPLLEESELDVTPEIIREFEDDLKQKNISLEFVSGAWSPQFVKLVEPKYDLILASETIYAPEVVPIFTDTLLNSLDPQGTALVAAKKIYFGVGGGVPEFEYQLNMRDIQHNLVLDYSEGVGRAILSVSSASL